jgi:uncharacterized membrane protein YqgA involved in biofilm formation
MIGPILNASAIAIGGMGGSLAGYRLPERIRHGLSHVFGLVAMGIGIILTVKAEHLAPIVLSLVVGTALGEYFRLQDQVHGFALKARTWVPQPRGGPVDDEEIDRVAATFSSLFVLLCASSTGLVGSLREGLSGDGSLLVAKSILDFFTAFIFAISVGFSVVALALPVLIIEGFFVFGSRMVAAHLSQSLIQDGSACGGIILVGTGLRILDIKSLRVINMLPSLFLIPIFSFVMARLPH